MLREPVNGWALKTLADLGLLDGQLSGEDLPQVLNLIHWPEDRGMITAVAALTVRGLNAELALELYGAAFELFLSGGTQMCRAFALDVLHGKAAFLRLNGRSQESKQVINLGVRLMKAWDFGPWHDSCAEFLEEIDQADLEDRLEITGSLMRTAAQWSINERYRLIASRANALQSAGRTTESESILQREIATCAYSGEQREILLVYRAECCRMLGKKRQALALCKEVMQTAKKDVFAHAALIQGMVQATQKRYEDALLSFRAGWRAASATAWGSVCALWLTIVLNGLDRHQDCLAVVVDARKDARFPMSSQICLNGALAAAQLGERETAKELLLIGVWAQVDQDFMESAYQIGLREDLRAALNQVAPAANNWIVTGEDGAQPSEVRMGRYEFAEYWSR